MRAKAVTETAQTKQTLSLSLSDINLFISLSGNFCCTLAYLQYNLLDLLALSPFYIYIPLTLIKYNRIYILSTYTNSPSPSLFIFPQTLEIVSPLLPTMDSSKQTILVTGGAGFIGTHTVVQLLTAGFRVSIIDNLDNAVEVAVHRVRELVGPQLSKNLDFHLVRFMYLLLLFEIKRKRKKNTHDSKRQL